MTEDERQWLSEFRRTGTHSVADDAAAQRNLQERGRAVLNARAAPRDWLIGEDPLVQAEASRRTWDVNAPPAHITNPGGLPAGAAWPRCVYHLSGRFMTVADQAAWTEVRKEDGWQLQPFEGFDYSSYYSLTDAVRQARTPAEAHAERFLAGSETRLVNFSTKDKL